MWPTLFDLWVGKKNPDDFHHVCTTNFLLFGFLPLEKNCNTNNVILQSILVDLTCIRVNKEAMVCYP